MTLPANLFIDTPEMQDASLHNLGTDTEAWPEEIIQKAKERLPQAGSMPMMVKFMKKDDENGTATGSVVITSADRLVILPVIVKDFMMFPLDVMIAANKLLPATPNYFGKVMSKNEIFSQIEEFPTYGGLGRFEDANLWNAVYPPSLGRYAYASAGYPILDSITETIDGSNLKQWLGENTKVAARLLSGPHAEVIKKIANMQAVNMNEFRQGADNLLSRNILMLRKDGPHKYSILSNSDSVFNPAITPCRREDVSKYISEISDRAEDDVNDVDQNGEKFLVIPDLIKDKNGPEILAQPVGEMPEAAKDFDHYSVKNKNGVAIEGMVIPKVIDFDQNIVDLKIFIGKTMSTVQPEIWGVRISNSRFSLPRQAPRIGQTGTFVYQPDKSHAIATEPVTIKAISQEGSNFLIKAYDLVGRPLHIKPYAGELQRIAKTTEGAYLLPDKMKWVPMDGFEEVTNSAADYAVKTAGLKKSASPVTVISLGCGQYSMKGISKYANAARWDATCLDRAQTKFMLASLGAGQEKIAKVIKHADTFGHIELHDLKRPPLASEKIAEARPLAEKMVKFARALRSNLAKEASYIENTQTVDALLSLNFVTPENISKFVGKVPQLKAAISSLASCLIASRLGVKEIPEGSVASAMSRLVEVVDGLEKLKATQEMGVQQ